MENDSTDRLPSSEPKESGVDPIQELGTYTEPPTALVPTPGGGALKPIELSGQLNDMLERGVRSQTGMVLLASGVQRLEKDLEQANERTDERDRALFDCRQEYWQLKEQTSVEKTRLETQLGEARGNLFAQKALVTIAGIVGGTSLTHLTTGPSGGWAGAGLVLSVVLLLVGWFFKRGGS